MKPLSIVIGLIAGVITLFLIRRKVKNVFPQSNTNTRPPSKKVFPRTPQLNDKLVIIKDVSYADLRSVLTGFCNMYNQDEYQAQPQVTKLSEKEFAITFPYDINFEIYCYFINFIKYPIDVKWDVDVIGWATPKKDDMWMTEKSINKKAMLFVPMDDTEYDNVYMTTVDNIGYKLSFAMNDGDKFLETPKKLFVIPRLEISELADKDFEEFI